MNNKMENSTTKLSYLLVGGGIGAILALLFAPKAGQELRADIADSTRKGLDRTQAIAGQISETAQTVYADTKTKAGEVYEAARQQINSAASAIKEMPGELQNAVQDKAEQISSSIEAGKKEYERESSAVNQKAMGKGNQ